MKRKILTIVGARPQFIKAAVVSRALLQYEGLQEVLVHTGQHFDDNMSAIFFDELGIPAPKYNLGIGGGSHGSNTGRAIEEIERVILAESPSYVLVYGDTDSTLAGAIAASKLCIPIAHVEAGLRSFNRHMPEEVNRVLTDHISTILFTPSAIAVGNLKAEGIAGPTVQTVGDVMYDAVRIFGGIAEQRSDVLERLNLRKNGYVLVTLHRKENTDDSARMACIMDGLSRSELPVVLPLHPRTKKRIMESGLQLDARINVVDPLGYLDMMQIERNANLIATDSGGVQKEAYFHGVPCVTLRDETEWMELVNIGVNRLVGADADAIGQALCEHKFNSVPRDVYGSGFAADKIAACMMDVIDNA